MEKEKDRRGLKERDWRKIKKERAYEGEVREREREIRA